MPQEAAAPLQCWEGHGCEMLCGPSMRSSGFFRGKSWGTLTVPVPCLSLDTSPRVLDPAVFPEGRIYAFLCFCPWRQLSYLEPCTPIELAPGAMECVAALCAPRQALLSVVWVGTSCLSSVDFGFFASLRKGFKLALWNVMVNYLALPLSYVTLEFRGAFL